MSVPVIASLNGAALGEWTQYAHLIEEAGADALELNLYYVPAEPHVTGEAVEQMHIDVVRAVRESVSIPLAVQIGPVFSSIPNRAQRLVEAGAAGLVLFNRFYQPDFDLDSRCSVMCPVLSTAEYLRLPLRWIGLLHGKVATDFALTGGVHTYKDVLKATFVGANVVMLASELLQHGLGQVVILRLRNMTAIDATSLHALEGLAKRLQASGQTLLLCGARDQPAKLLEQSAFVKHFGRENILPHVDAALARAQEIAESFGGIGPEFAKDYDMRAPL